MAKKRGQKQNQVRVHWWLGRMSVHGYASELIDGPHSDGAGVEQAFYLIKALGLVKSHQYCCVRVEESDVTPKSHGTNHDALRCMQGVMGVTEDTNLMEPQQWQG